MTGPSSSRVWFITGAGRGLGRAFATEALAAGDRVVATVRSDGVLDDLIADHPDALRVLMLDVRDRAAAFTTVDRARACYGRLDVIVNNAGYGLVGAIEEIAEQEASDQLATNLFGAMWVTQAVLPHLRSQGSGHIVQISTVGAVGTMPTLGIYNASKWALEGFSEALAAEVAPFGIRVTIAELGGFATDWAGSSMRFATPTGAYDELRTQLFGSPHVPWDASEQPDDSQPGSDVAARALLEHLDRPEGPLRLLIGTDAPEQVGMALAMRRDDYAHNHDFVWPPQP
jgi:NAD(P)-dependent dehydrogenase (short-subunit alcohol dehydrogenase family)